MNSSAIKSTIIVSVYTDHIALGLILRSLHNQTKNNFEVIVSEDGKSESINTCINDFLRTKPNLNIKHLSQDDKGFRKNRALNKAIKEAKSDHLIFIDGDCIPHTAFIEAHQEFAKPSYACTGRRLELGETMSKKLRENKINISRLTNIFLYNLNIITLILDKSKNIESGIYSKLLQHMTTNKEIRILGCNFSCSKSDLLKINGFNTDYRAPGIGEDSDIDWRLLKSGAAIKNVKFSAIQYHLYHPRTYSPSAENIAIYNKTKQSVNHVCLHGIDDIIK